MRTLVLLAFLFSCESFAGQAKLSWTHDKKATDGSLVTLTGFRVFWGINGQPETNVIALTNPMPLPWKVVGGVYTWSKTLDNVAWVPGSTVCFRMTALASDLESDQTGQACKTFPLDPNAPTIIDVTIP
jgi:hypothetical protein